MDYPYWSVYPGGLGSFSYVNADKFTEWRVKPDYSSISSFSSSIWGFIIGVIGFDKCVCPTTTTSSISAGVHWVHIIQ